MLNRFRWWLTFVIEKLVDSYWAVVVADAYPDAFPGEGYKDVTALLPKGFYVAVQDTTRDWKRVREVKVGRGKYSVFLLHATQPAAPQPFLSYVLPPRVRQGIATWVRRGAHRVHEYDVHEFLRWPLTLLDGLGYETVCMGRGTILFGAED